MKKPVVLDISVSFDENIALIVADLYKLFRMRKFVKII